MPRLLTRLVPDDALPMQMNAQADARERRKPGLTARQSRNRATPVGESISELSTEHLHMSMGRRASAA